MLVWACCADAGLAKDTVDHIRKEGPGGNQPKVDPIQDRFNGAGFAARVRTIERLPPLGA
jgi:hypothetical protein